MHEVQLTEKVALCWYLIPTFKNFQTWSMTTTIHVLTISLLFIVTCKDVPHIMQTICNAKVCMDEVCLVAIDIAMYYHQVQLALCSSHHKGTTQYFRAVLQLCSTALGMELLLFGL